MDPRYARWLIGIGSAIVVLLVALVVIVAAGDGDTGASGTTATTVPGASTTAAPTTVTTAAPATATTVTTVAPTTVTTVAPTTVTTAAPTTTTTAAPSPACVDVGPVPGGATDLTSVPGDYDGDGAADEFSAYQLGTSWFLWAHLSDGDYRLVTEISLPWSFEYWDGTTPNNVAVVDANSLGDPRRAATVRLYAGLGQSYALFGVEDCAIVPFLTPGGTIPPLYHAMGANHSDFPVCDAADEMVRQVVVSCGGDVSTCPTLDISTEEWAVSRDPALLTPNSTSTGTIDQAQYGVIVANSCIG